MKLVYGWDLSRDGLRRVDMIDDRCGDYGSTEDVVPTGLLHRRDGFVFMSLHTSTDDAAKFCEEFYADDAEYNETVFHIVRLSSDAVAALPAEYDVWDYYREKAERERQEQKVLQEAVRRDPTLAQKLAEKAAVDIARGMEIAAQILEQDK